MTEVELVALACFSFIAGVVGTLAGMGGGMVLLASTTLILPMSAVLPLNGVFLMGAQLSRLYHFYLNINWDITRPFVLGALIGAVPGALTYSRMSDFVISLLLSLTILGILWLPSVNVKVSVPYPYVLTGAAHTWLSSITGLGGLLQGIMLRGGHPRNTIIATIAASLLSMSALKTLGYLWVGFNYRPYILAIVVSIIGGFLGTWAGKCCLGLVSEERFRFLMRWMLTLFALRLFWASWALG